MILGKRSLIDQIVKHPLLAAVQANKLTLAALAATLGLSTDPAAAERAIPVLSLLATPLENLRNRAERLAPQMAATGVGGVEVIVGRGICRETRSRAHHRRRFVWPSRPPRSRRNICRGPPPWSARRRRPRTRSRAAGSAERRAAVRPALGECRAGGGWSRRGRRLDRRAVG